MIQLEILDRDIKEKQEQRMQKIKEYNITLKYLEDY